MSDQMSTRLVREIRESFDGYGLADIVGIEELEQGLRELAAGLMPLLGELVAVEASGLGLSEAVFDERHYPHLVRAHGFLNDVLVMELPSDLRSWAEELTQSHSYVPRAKALRKMTADVALRGADSRALLARFALFEALCLNQRLLLLAERQHLEAVNGRQRDIETIAEREVDLAVSWERYGAELSESDDPLRALIAAAALALQEHVAELNEELRTLKAPVHEGLRDRRRILEVMDELPADQAVLVQNECAEIFGEDKLEAEQLRVHHPAMYGAIGRDAIYQRVHRLPARIDRLNQGQAPVKKPSIADYILRNAPQNL